MLRHPKRYIQYSSYIPIAKAHIFIGKREMTTKEYKKAGEKQNLIKYNKEPRDSVGQQHTYNMRNSRVKSYSFQGNHCSVRFILCFVDDSICTLSNFLNSFKIVHRIFVGHDSREDCSYILGNANTVFLRAKLLSD